MSKFNTPATRTTALSPISSEETPSGRTFEGGPGYKRNTKSELFLLAVSNMVGEKTFYEAATARDSRFRQLIRTVATDDAGWLLDFLRWLRKDANMRSAALVGAAEAVKARLDAAKATDPTNLMYNEIANRSIIDAVLQRADEPGEMLAYWTSQYGKNVPKPVKRGIADAVQRLYNEKSLLKYDTASKGFRFGDVLELTHARPTFDVAKFHPEDATYEFEQAWLRNQGDLFQYAIDRRHNRGNAAPQTLLTVTRHQILHDYSPEQRRELFTKHGDIAADTLKRAGFTWEHVSGWLQGPMTAQVWEAIIPSMGYMALLRNLRNFDEAGISDETAADVAKRLADPDQVAKSKQLPMRFLSAYRAAPSLRWAYPLEQAIGQSLTKIPSLAGRTLILVDTSGSMYESFSKDGTLMRWDAAALFGVALGQRCDSADVVSFSASWYGKDSTKQFPLHKGESLLRAVERWKSGGYFLGGGTDTSGAVRRHLSGHDRVVIVTDEQAGGRSVDEAIPSNVPLYTWNLAGYQHGHAPSGSRNRHTFAGLTDQAFHMIPLLESGQSGVWPWM